MLHSTSLTVSECMFGKALNGLSVRVLHSRGHPGMLHARRLAGSLQSINSFKARPICHKPGVTIAGRIAFDNALGISTVSGPAPGNFFGVAMASA